MPGLDKTKSIVYADVWKSKFHSIFCELQEVTGFCPFRWTQSSPQPGKSSGRQTPQRLGTQSTGIAGQNMMKQEQQQLCKIKTLQLFLIVCTKHFFSFCQSWVEGSLPLHCLGKQADGGESTGEFQQQQQQQQRQQHQQYQKEINKSIFVNFNLNLDRAF